MQSSLSRLCFLFVVVTLSATAIAQQPIMPKADTTKKNVGPPNAPKPYKEVITEKAKTSRGLFIVHKVEDKYYFELPVKLLSRDLLVVNRVSKSSIESPKSFNGYAGDQIGQNVLRFERGPTIKYF